ncbi:MAG: acyltransferase [Planctomycetes bacterium]|nr:acyltransferase [Planctomycetota bacterium]
MNRIAKSTTLMTLWIPALILRFTAGLRRCFSLAWARAHLGRAAVPFDNQILGLIDFEGTCRIRLGRNCQIYKHVRLETQESGEIIIEDNVVLSPGTLIASHDRISIGSYTMIGEFTSIRDQDHRTDSAGPVRESGYVSAAINIGRDVWIGRGCVVLKGVTIGDRAIIGANSVVTRDVPPDEVWLGSPARCHHKRYDVTSA